MAAAQEAMAATEFGVCQLVLLNHEAARVAVD
jgi:hypothetical protein